MMKRILVSFLLIVSILFSVGAVSASPLASGDHFSNVEVNGVELSTSGLGNPAIIAGETIVVKIEFESMANASDVIVEAELKTNRERVRVTSNQFDVETGQVYVKTLKIQVPFDLRDVLSDSATLNIEADGQGYKTEASYPLRIQREPYNAEIRSVNVPQTVDAGERFPVEIVLKNFGYNNLEDLFVTAKIPELEIERMDFFGDLVALSCDEDTNNIDNYGVDISRKCNEDDEDTLKGRLFLEIPYDTKSGVYALEVEVQNEDTVSSRTVQLVINNDFSAGNFIVSGSDLLIVNPTDNVVVYRFVPENTASVSVSVSENIVAVPAGSSRMISTSASSNQAGTFTYNVNVFSANGELVDTVQFSGTAAGTNATSPVVVLTVILAVIFIVLLVVLIVLIGKKPKTEEFGESYY